MANSKFIPTRKNLGDKSLAAVDGPMPLDFFRRASDFFGLAARRVLALSLAGTLVLCVAGCGIAQGDDVSSAGDAAQQTNQTVGQGASNGTATSSDEIDVDDLFSDRDLDQSYDAAEATSVELKDEGTVASGEGVAQDGSTVTISAEGVYVLTGELSDGRVVVDAGEDAKVQLVLDGVSISSSTGTSLYVRSADKVFVTTTQGSSNTLAAAGDATEEDDHTLDGTLFSVDDLTIGGEGTLIVSSAKGNGVVGKDEVTLTGGTLEVSAAEHAVQANDSVAVAAGTYELEAGKDGIHVSGGDEEDAGFLYVAGGTLTLSAGSDGIDADGDIQIDGGSITVNAGDDGIHSEAELIVNDGTIDVQTSKEGLEGAQVTLNGGDTNVVSLDDGVNATGEGSNSSAEGMPRGMGEGEVRMGAEDLPAGDPGSTMDVAGEDVQPTMTQAKGNPRGGQPQGMGDMGDMGEGGQPQGMGDMGDMPTGGQPQGMGGAMMDSDSTAILTISGGRLVVDAGGDGLDSNGTLVVTGGQTYVNGPTNDGNAPLDYGISATVTGGTLMAVGSAGMAQGFGSDSTQGSLLVSASGGAGDTIELVDAEGNVLASMSATKDYACVAITAPGVEAGGTYTLTYGSQQTTIQMDSLTYSDVHAAMGGGGSF